MFFIYITFLSAFAAEPKLPAHRLAVTDGGSLTLPTIQFAVTGNTRPSTPLLDKGRAVEGSQATATLGDILAQNIIQPLDFVVHTGDMVTQSTSGGWGAFGDQFSSIIDGSTPPKSPTRRIPIIPVTGDRDCVKDSACQNISTVFPGFGADIGFGRVATWQSFELKAGEGEPIKVLVLDSNKKGLGSRWKEQMAWLANQSKDPKGGFLLFVHDPAASVLEPSISTQELVEHIETHAPLMSIKAIFSAGPSLTQALMPDGVFGTAHFGAGGGGAPAADFPRGVQGGPEAKQLAPGFDRALDGLVNSYGAAAAPPSERVMDEALGLRSFKGYPRRISGGEIPTFGWWRVILDGTKIDVAWRALQPDGTFKKQAGWRWTTNDGWSPQGQ